MPSQDIKRAYDTISHIIETRNRNKENFCIHCNKKYLLNAWDFLKLCNECFAEFDKLKMEGRHSGSRQCETYEQFVKLQKIERIK
jgi:hypothetical protein